MTQAHLFQRGTFTLASGKVADWKIECDALTEADWEALAVMILERCRPFGEVCGIPRGGLMLERLLKPFVSRECKDRLLVDDVWTTGGTFAKWRMPGDECFVVFARSQPTDGTRALFVMQ